MAKVLRIADITQGTTVNILSGALGMEQSTWRTRQAGDRVIETMDLVAVDTDANIMAGEAAINNALYETRRWHRDPLLGRP